jgi:DNA-binding HxlR family transcriptional regulator
MEAERDRLAGFRSLMGILVRKWTVEIMYCLYENERMRFSQLRRALKGVSSRTLSDRLRELEELGLVRREVFPEKPVRVEYMLTPGGKRVGEQAYESLGRLVDVWKTEVGLKEG